jgi:hypothetical protein
MDRPGGFGLRITEGTIAMRALRMSIILGGGALAIGAGVLIAGPALASGSGDREVIPAVPVPAGVTVVDGGVAGEDPALVSGS